jgi:putative ABC transport system ATP-binding protein
VTGSVVPAIDAMPLVRVDQVTKVYRRAGGDVTALQDVTIQVLAGELVVISGPSGSGKTTVLNVVIGWETPDSGTVHWGVDEGGGAVDNPTWQRLAVVPQRLGLLDDLTVAENLELPLRIRGASDDERVTETLGRLGLTDLGERMARELSLGQQQRLCLGRAVIDQPSLIVADEPTGHQDDASTGLVVAALLGARDAGSALLVATHDHRIADLADHVVRLRDGRLV